MKKNNEKNSHVLVIDNYDSFTYNLVQTIKKVSKFSVDVFRNNEISINEINNYKKIILSPGPGLPKDAGLLLEIIKTFAPKKRILGVCLGHQAIGEAFGASLYNMNKVIHGIATPITVTKNKSVLYKNLPKTFNVGRYHSWIIKKENLPECFDITAVDSEEIIMSIKHKNYDVEGVQFHPESILTPLGGKIIKNWLDNDNQD